MIDFQRFAIHKKIFFTQNNYNIMKRLMLSILVLLCFNSKIWSQELFGTFTATNKGYLISAGEYQIDTKADKNIH